RRRHTRFARDWSSDVCSSDLEAGRQALVLLRIHGLVRLHVVGVAHAVAVGVEDEGRPALRCRGIARLQELLRLQPADHLAAAARSEERRVAKASSTQWSALL